MYDLNPSQHDSFICNDENSLKMINSWSNIQSNDLWLNNNNYSNKPQFERTEFGDLTNTNYAFNNTNTAYNQYFNQSYAHSHKQNYYGYQSTGVAPVQLNSYSTNNQLNNFYDNNIQSVVRNEQSDDSTNTSRTSPIEQSSNEKVTDSSSVSNESTDKMNKSNSYDSNKEINDENNVSNNNNIINSNLPTYFTTQKIVNNTVKLSYTAYQLELLNAIYTDMKYPNSVQKTLIAKMIGITRDQVKIWFQNRRRKDTLVSQGKMPSTLPNVLKTDSKKRGRSSDESELNEEDNFPSSPEQQSSDKKKQVVETQVIQNVLFQLRSHQNAPSRLSSKRTKPNSAQEQSDEIIKPSDNLMIPPNRVSDVPTSELVNKSQQSVNNSNDLKFKSDYGMVNNQALTPSSLSSFSSASSSSATSSDEDNVVNYVQKYQTLPQPFSFKEYADTRYMANYYKQPKVHNQQYQFNKLNPWANSSTQQHVNFNTHSADAYSSNQLSNENIYKQYTLNNYELASNYMPKYHAPVQQNVYNPIQSVQANYQFMTNNNYGYSS